MAGQIGLLSATQLQKLAQEQLTSGSSMRNARQAPDIDDDSWEVRAFAEDTANILGATWPPQSYTCTFCRREFKTAQALGGHMNVHRRDRARLQQIKSGATIHPSPASLLFPTEESVGSSDLCLFYPFPTPGSVSSLTPITPGEGFLDFPSSTLLPLSPYPLLPCSPSSSASKSCELFHHQKIKVVDDDDDDDDEELDLELRLGQRPLNQ